MRNKNLRILSLTLTLIVVFPLALLAADWQLNRHREREILNQQLITSYTKLPKKVVSFKDVDQSKDAEYLRYKINATLSSEITWWRKQSLDGIPGYIALTVCTDQTGSKAVVALGWSQTVETIKLPAERILIGRLRIMKILEPDPSDIPIGQTNSPATLISANDKFYFEITNLKIQGLAEIPLPEITSGPHLGYVGQWILIAIFAICVYVIAIRNLREN